MERENLGRYYADNVGLIHMAAKKGYGRLAGLGAPVEYDDVFQDMTETFIKAFDGFNEELGNKFSTYFMFSAGTRINKLAEKVWTERVEGKTRSVQEMSARMAGDDGDTPDLLETIASDALTPEQTAMANSMTSQLFESLSPLAAKILEMALDPPEFLERELAAGQAHAELARSKGMARRARVTINVGFVIAVLTKTTSLPVQTLASAKVEITEAIKRVTT